MTALRIILVAVSAVTLAACGGGEDILYGYAEGEFRLLAPESAGRIATMFVEEGARVEAGALLARLDPAREEAELARAEAAAEAAAARFDDAAAGGREPEIQAAGDMLARARATAQQAQEDLNRVRSLFDRGVVARARLDAALAASRSADASVAEMRERVTLAELPARENALRALAAETRAADAAVALAREALADRTLSAPAAGRVERILRREGETAGPAAPIVRFLPDGAMEAIVFLPEPRLGAFAPGDRLLVSCDACSHDLSAVITYIADDVEFTPPIIYSDVERARLMFRAEARFEGDAPPAGTPLRFEAAS